MKAPQSDGRPQLSNISPVVGAGLTIAGWVVVANVAWQLLAGLGQAMVCEIRSRRPLECLPAWSQMQEIGQRSTDTLFALVVHSPADSAAAALGGAVGGVVYSRRRGTSGGSTEGPSSSLNGVVPSPDRDDDETNDELPPA